MEIAREMALDYDAVVILSGDGLTHEVFNGFAEHENPRDAFAIPLAPIPTGSGNGCCLSLLGLKVNSSYETLPSTSE
jgi:sphingosine kinase